MKDNIPEKIPVLHVITGTPRNERGLMELIHARNYGMNHFFLFDNPRHILNIWPEWRKYQYCSLFLPSKSAFARYQYLKAIFNKADKIIFHGMFFIRKLYYILFHLNKHLLKKATWIEWGGDLYDWEVPETGIISRMLNRFGREMRRNISQVVLILPIDEIEYRKKYGQLAETIHLSLPSTRPMLERIDKAYSAKTSKAIRIHVGNNGLLSNNQLRILDTLSKFKNEDLQIIIPLAYNIGDLKNIIDKKAYKSAVINYAKYLFGKKAVPFLKTLNLDYYMKYLWTVDIVIFDVHRPIGLGTILYMIYMGNKVFLPRDSLYYQYLTDNGLKVFDTYSINSMSFEEFSAPVVQENIDYLLNIFDYDNNIKKWEKLLDDWALGSGNK